MTELYTPAPKVAPPLLGFLLAMPLGLLPLLLPPSSFSALPLLIALPLQLAGAAWALGHRAEPGLKALVLRRFWISALLVGLASLVLTALLAWPVQQLVLEASLTSTLLVSAAVAAGGLCLWRYWPATLLPWIDPPPATRRPPPLTRAMRDARRLVQSDPSAARGLLATLLLLVLLLGPLLLGLGDPYWPETARLIALPLWSLLIAPFLAFALVALVEPARLASASVSISEIPALSEAAPEPELLLPAGLDPTQRLYAVARTGRVDLALSELAAGADPHALPDPAQRDQRSLAMLAAVLGDLRLLRALIAGGVDLNRRHAGLTPLLAATRDSLHGRPEAVMTLLANGADPRGADADGRTPLHFAALVGDPEVAALLLDANADINACNRDGYSALGVACAAGNWRIAAFLLDRKARTEPEGGQPSLLAAAAGEDDATGVALLLRHKASVDATGKLGRTALMNACLSGNLEIVDALLKAGASAAKADDHRVTPLLEAARAGASAVVRRLASAKPDPSARDQNGRGALLLACQSPAATAETIGALIELGCDPEQPAADGRRPLEVAIAAARWPLVARLDPNHSLPSSHDGGARLPDPDRQDTRPWRDRLHAALLDDEGPRVAQLLLEQRDPATCRELFDSFGPRLPTPLRQQLAAGFATDPAASEGSTPSSDDSALWGCLAAADGEGIDVLLERGASAGGRGGLARYLAACMQRPAAGAERRAQRLLASGADPFVGAAGDPPIALAVRLGWNDLLDDLLTIGVDPQCVDARGDRPLAVAVSRRSLPTVQRLLRHGAQPQLATADGRTARGIALSCGQPELVEWLDWSRWQLPARPLRPADLVAAAGAGDRAAVGRLLALGLPIDGVDAQGATALLRACGGGHAELAGDLLSAGADPKHAASSGATCVSAAVSRRQLAVIELLLKRGVPIDQPLPGGITPLMIAAALGFADVSAVLLKAGAAIDAVDERGEGALHALAQFGFGCRERAPALLNWSVLLDAGGKADGRNAEGLSPLLLLLGSRVEPGSNPDEDCLTAQVERLLQYKVALDVRDARGFTALHLAALHGQMRVARRLLQAGASIEARDALNRLPQDVALMRGFVDIARELGSGGGAPPLARLLRDPSR